MQRAKSRLGLAVVALASAQLAHGGPIIDMLRERAAARHQQADGDDSPMMMGFGRRQQQPVVVPPGTRIERDLAYGSDPGQRIDVYIPEKLPPNAPVIFMVHGGAWMLGDKNSGGVVNNKAAHWMPRGYVFVSVGYPLFPKHTVLEQADDIAKALAFAQGKAASWGADPGRFVMMGHSAGAHLVSLVTADPTIATRAGAKKWLGTVSLDSAAMNLVDTMEHKHYRFYDRVFGTDEKLWRDASPTLRMTQAPAPMLLVCGTRREDSCPQADALAAKAKSLGGKVSVLRIGLSHMEINTTLGESGPMTQGVDEFLHSLGLP
jgi:acetyl esterase/lipase